MRLRLTKQEREGISKMFSDMGKRGGYARAAKLTPEQKRDAAIKAALTRWRKEVQKTESGGLRRL